MLYCTQLWQTFLVGRECFLECSEGLNDYHFYSSLNAWCLSAYRYVFFTLLLASPHFCTSVCCSLFETYHSECETLCFCINKIKFYLCLMCMCYIQNYHNRAMRNNCRIKHVLLMCHSQEALVCVIRHELSTTRCVGLLRKFQLHWLDSVMDLV